MDNRPDNNMAEDPESDGARQRAGTLLEDLAVLYDTERPNGWHVYGWAFVARVLTVFGLLALGAWYDYNKLAPGPITMAILGAYVLPPFARMLQQYRAESRYTHERQQHIMMLQQHLAQLPHAEIVTRLAAMTARGMRTTDVIEGVRVLALNASARREVLGPGHDTGPQETLQAHVDTSATLATSHHGDTQ